jgi:hypothetical protein
VYQFLLNLRLESNLIATLLLARYAGCKAGSKSDSFEFVLSFGLLLGVFQKAVEIDRCHHRQMVRSDSGNGRDVRLHLDQRGTRSNPNAIEGEQRKKRWEAPEAGRLAEFSVETENRRAEGKPFVHVEQRDGRTGPLLHEQLQQSLGLIAPLAHAQAEMRDDDPHGAVADGDIGIDGAARLAAGNAQI